MAESQSQSSFVSDTGAALEQAMALLEQKGLIIQKYMQKMANQQSKIQQLVEQIQRLNWQNREKEYNEESIRKIPLKDLIEQGFIQEIQIETNDNECNKSQQNDQIMGVKENLTYQNNEPRKLYVVRVILDSESEQIMLTGNMQLLKDNINIYNNNLTNKNKMNGIGPLTNIDDQSQQFIESYCEQVLKQVEEMKLKMEKQGEQNKQQLIILKKQNQTLKETISKMQQNITQLKKQHHQQLILKQKQINQIKKLIQFTIEQVKQGHKASQSFFMEQIRLRILQIDDINQEFRKQRNNFQKTLQEKTQQIQLLQSKIKQLTQQKQKQLSIKDEQLSLLRKQLSCIRKQLQQMKIICQTNKQQKQHSIILQKSIKLQTYCQTDPQLVLDIDFLRKTKLQITKRRSQMRQMKLSPDNIKHNYQVIQQTHKDSQGVQYKICLPPSLDVIAFDFQHSVSSQANISPQKKMSNKSSSSFQSNERRIQQMYTIPKQKHNQRRHQIRHNVAHVQKEYLSQPTIPHEPYRLEHKQSKQSLSEQSDRIRVTPESGVQYPQQQQSIKQDNFVNKQKNKQQRQHNKQVHEQHNREVHEQHNRELHEQHYQNQLKQLHMKPKVSSYSQRNIIVQQLNQDEDHHQLLHDKNNKAHQYHKHKMKYVNVVHHHQNNHVKVHQTNTMNDNVVTGQKQQHDHNKNQRISDQLLPPRSALSHSSASSIKQISPHDHYQIQQKLNFNYQDDDNIIDQNLQNSDHPSQTYKNSLRFPNGYCSGSMDKIHHKQHNQYHQSYQLSKSIGYDLHHQRKHPYHSQAKNAKQLLQLKSPQIVMKSLIDKSFPIQKNPFKLSNQFINVAQLLKQEKKQTHKNHNKIDYLTVNKIKQSSNPGSDSLVNIMIQSHQQQHDHVQQSTSNHDTTKQKQSQEKIIQHAKNQTTKTSNFKTPKKHKTIQLTQSLDFQSLKKIETQNITAQNNTKSKKKQKIIYLRR